MRQVTFIMLSTLALLVGCASSEYVCPDPIGKIIRDDCEVYKTRFETLKAELSAGVLLAQASIKVGKESLRDPSQLMQILSHRTFALCRDFNACRVSPQEYRERRERVDHIFTAVGAINAQLKSELPAEEKRKLVAKLAALLSSDRPPRRQTDSTISDAPTRPKLRGVAYRSSFPWYGTKVLPPQRQKVPYVGHAGGAISHVFRSGRGAVGYRLSVNFLVRPPLSPDDLFTMRYGGRSVDCRMSRSKWGVNGMISVRCETKKDEPLTSQSLQVSLFHTPDGEGKARQIGSHTFKLLSRVTNPRNGSRSFGHDPDDAAKVVLLRFRPAEGVLPPGCERPSLVSVLKLRDWRRKTVTARCWVDGKPATSAISSYGRYSGQAGQFQDRDRYRRTGPGRSEAVKYPFITWRRYDFPLPFFVRHGDGSPPEGTKAWPRAGRWRCVISFEGDPVREARFVVKDDGSLEPSEAQRQRSAADWWLETKVIPSRHEEPLR